MWKDTIEVMCSANNYSLIHYIKGGQDEWNIAYKYNPETKDWASGNYCYTLESALRTMADKISSEEKKIIVVMEEGQIEKVYCSENNFTYSFIEKGSWDSEEEEKEDIKYYKVDTTEKYKTNLNDYKAEIHALIDAYSSKEQVGFITEKTLSNLLSRLNMEDYCIRHQIPYEQLTEVDYVAKYEESINDYNEEYER